MSGLVSARQAAGGKERQTRDAEVSSGVVPTPAFFAKAFLEANLASLALPSVTTDAVRAAESHGEVCEPVHGEPVLRVHGKTLGGAPSDAELADATRGNHDTVYVVFGLGLGHTVKALRMHTDAPIVVFEPDPSLLRAVLELGPMELPCFDIVSNSHDLTQIWPSFFSGRQTATIINCPGYSAVYPDEAAHLRTTLAELVQRSRVNDQTHRLRARDWVKDVLANVELLREHPGFLALAGKYRGVPAFIVGAGPSLGKNGHHLLQAQKKGLVFAVNSSARALDKLGVTPQVVACMESIDVSHLLAGVSYIDRVIRAITLTAHPNTIRTGNGPLLPLWEGIPQIAHPMMALTGLPGVPVAGSVSTIAFALAQRLGCSPIVFVGQDLAYTDGRAYAPGSPYEASRVAVSSDGRKIQMDWCDTLKKTHQIGGRSMHESEPMNETTAWGGQGKVLTTIGFSAVRSWLESAAIVLGRELADLRLVNATEGGARIKGFEEIELERLLSELPDHEIRPEDMVELARRQAPLPSGPDIAAWADAQAQGVQHARHVARRIRRLASASLQGIRLGSPDVNARLKRLDDAERELSQAVAAAPLLDAWSWPDVDRVMLARKPTSDDPRESAERALEFETNFGEAVAGSARELERELDALSRSLRSEAGPSPAQAQEQSQISGAASDPAHRKDQS